MPEASRLLRVSMVAAGLAVTYAGFVLFVFPDRSADLFTWDIQPPVTAAYLGAMYATGTPLLFFVGRRGTSWLRVRAVLPPFVTVSVGMLIATLAHADRFIWSSAVTWLWLALYSVFPPLIVYLYVQHQRRVEAEPPPALALGPRFRSAARALGAVVGAYGLGLLAVPTAFDGLWPWPLTPLTGRTVGAWLLSLGVALVAVSLERDWAAIRLIAPQGVLVTVLLLAGVARFADELDWNDVKAWIYLGGLIAALVGGVAVYAAFESRYRKGASRHGAAVEPRDVGGA